MAPTSLKRFAGMLLIAALRGGNNSTVLQRSRKWGKALPCRTGVARKCGNTIAGTLRMPQESICPPKFDISPANSGKLDVEFIGDTTSPLILSCAHLSGVKAAPLNIGLCCYVLLQIAFLMSLPSPATRREDFAKRSKWTPKPQSDFVLSPRR